MRLSAIAALGIACSARVLAAQELNPAWERFDFAQRRIQTAAADSLDLQQLQRLRAIVFGRRGRTFSDQPELQEFLESRPWYHADTAFRNARLTAVERANLDVIREAESRKHTQIETGDMRYHRGQVITTTMLGHHTWADWIAIAAEVEALHGKMFGGFDDEPDTTDADGNEVGHLQLYFNERYWYRADPAYTPARLSVIERANLDTIALARMRDMGLTVAPGMMYLFRDQPLTDKMLRGVTLHELRILRNEIFARRGRRFQTPWLREHFGQQPWYQPRATYSDRDLSGVDSANIALITAAESRSHEDLSSRELGPYALNGLFPETARRLRNEIFARHGRTFRDPTLQSYFASFAWYKPDPQYSDRALTAVERKNVQTILAHEQRANMGSRFTGA